MRLPTLTQQERDTLDRLHQKAGQFSIARQAAAYQEIVRILADHTEDWEKLVNISQVIEDVNRLEF